RELRPGPGGPPSGAAADPPDGSVAAPRSPVHESTRAGSRPRDHRLLGRGRPLEPGRKRFGLADRPRPDATAPPRSSGAPDERGGPARRPAPAPGSGHAG